MDDQDQGLEGLAACLAAARRGAADDCARLAGHVRGTGERSGLAVLAVKGSVRTKADCLRRLYDQAAGASAHRHQDGERPGALVARGGVRGKRAIKLRDRLILLNLAGEVFRGLEAALDDLADPRLSADEAAARLEAAARAALQYDLTPRAQYCDPPAGARARLGARLRRRDRVLEVLSGARLLDDLKEPPPDGPPAAAPAAGGPPPAGLKGRVRARRGPA